MNNQIEQAVQLANGEFIKGFIAGQTILCVLIFFLLKVFLFRNSTETRSELAKNRKHWQPKPINMTLQQKYAIDSLILTKLQYNIESNPMETCAWINVLLAQFISTFRNNTQFLQELVSKFQDLTSNEPLPTFMGPVTITDLSLGEEYPEFRNARVEFSESGQMQIKVDFKYDDQMTIAIETMALVNWPKPAMASLPISLSFSLVRFSGTFVLEFQSTSEADLPNSEIKDSSIACFVNPDFVLDFSVGSLLGHRTKVKDLPKLTILITTMLKNVFTRELVYPSKKKFTIPKNPLV